MDCKFILIDILKFKMNWYVFEIIRFLFCYDFIRMYKSVDFDVKKNENNISGFV